MSDPIMTQEREAVACAERIVERTYNCGELEIEAKIVAQAFLALRSGGEGWQDISTAPKDGTRFLAAGGGLDRTETCSWNENVGCWGAESVTLDDTAHESEGYNRPTKWMPLPSPPSIQGEG